MDFSSFMTSLATSFIVFLFLVLVFTWLSRQRGNDVIYYPNRILKGMDAWEGKRTRNPFAWIGEALSSTEDEIISMAGVDTAVYFVFLSSVLGILVLSAVLLLPALLPVAGTGKALEVQSQSNSNGTFNNMEKLGMGNVKVDQNSKFRNSAASLQKFLRCSSGSVVPSYLENFGMRYPMGRTAVPFRFSAGRNKLPLARSLFSHCPTPRKTTLTCMRYALR